MVGGGGGGGGGLEITKLVYPQSRRLLDSAVGVITPLRDFRTGYVYSATLWRQTADVALPATPVQVVNGNLVPGPGWASIQPGRYGLDILEPVSGLRSTTFVSIYSDKPSPVAIATNASELGDRLTAVAALISANPSAFAGAAIDLDPAGSFGNFTINQLPAGPYPGRVVLRSASPDRINGPQPTFSRITGQNEHRVGLQSLKFRVQTNGSTNLFIDLDNASNSTGSAFWWIENCDFLGGRPILDGAGGLTMDPEGAIDPTSGYEPMHTCLQLFPYNAAPTELAVWDGNLQVTRGGATIGAGWVNMPLNSPAFVGMNAPLGIVQVSHIPAYNSTTGGGFDAQIEVLEFVGSTPVVSPTTGASFTKPANGPDGRYIVATRFVSAGTGYTWDNDARYRVRWTGQRYFASGGGSGLPEGIKIGRIGGAPNIAIANCRFRSLVQGVQLGITSGTDAPWFQDNYMDTLALDMVRILSQRGAGSAILTHNFGHEIRLDLNYWGRRFVSQTGDLLSPHGDIVQAVWSTAGDAGSGGAQLRLIATGNIWWEWGTARGISQGLFLKDYWPVNSGFRVYSHSNLIGVRMSNAFVISALITEDSRYDLVTQNQGPPANDVRYPDQALFPSRIIRIGGFANGYRGNTLAAERMFLDQLTFTRSGTDAALFEDPLYSWTDSKAELARRFTPKGAGLGRGPFGDVANRCDILNGVFNPDLPWYPLFPEVANAVISTVVETADRFVENRRSPSVVSAPSEGQWIVGGVLQPVGQGVTVPPGVSLRWRGTSAATNSTPKDVTFTVDGVAHKLRVRTEFGPVLGPLEPGEVPLILTESALTAGNSAVSAWTAMNAVSVPVGGRAILMVVNDAAPATIGPDDVVNTDGVATPVTTEGWEPLESASATEMQTRLYQWRNLTNAPQAVSFRMEASTAVRMCGILYVLGPATPGASVEMVRTARLNLGELPIEFGRRDLDGHRKFLTLAMAGVDNRELGTGTPADQGTDFTNKLTALTNTTTLTAAVTALSWRLARQFNTVDPSGFSTSATRRASSFTIAAYEVVP